MRGEAAVGLLVFAMGCHSVLGIEDLPAGRAAVTYAVPACGQCVASTCAALRDRCVGDAKCDAVLRCTAACPVDRPDCRFDCAARAIGGSAPPLFIAYDDCVRGSCLPQCLGGSGLLRAVDSGCSCLDTACAKEAAECIAGPEPDRGSCERTFMCIGRGLNPDAAVGCYATAGRTAPVDSLRNCFLTHPCEACALARGNVFACQDRYKWAAVSGTVTLTFGGRLTPVVSGGKLSGVRVQACERRTCECRETDAFTTTDAEGHFSLTLRAPYDFCFEVSGQDANTMRKVSPTNFLLGRPIVRNEDFYELPTLLEGDLDVLGATADPPVAIDPGLSHFAVIASDCVLSSASGVTLTVDGEEGYYVAGDGRLRKGGPTSGRGTAALMNRPLGSLNLQMSFGSRPLRTLQAFGKAGHLIVATLFPTPQG